MQNITGNAHSGMKCQCLLHYLIQNVHNQPLIPLTGSDLFQSPNNTDQQNLRTTKLWARTDVETSNYGL